MAGAGTIGLEVIEDLPDVDAVVIPVGGGNLIAGMSLAMKEINPEIRIIGVQAENAPSVYLSWQQGKLVNTESCDTFAGGLATRYPGQLSFDILKDRVDEMHLVSEDEMKQAIPVVLAHTGYIAEGAAASVFALCLRQADAWAGRRVAAIFSGANLGMEMLREVVRG
jgi:threonine dehydratase